MLRLLCFPVISKTIVIVLLFSNATFSAANPAPVTSQKSSSASNSNHISPSDSSASAQKDSLVKRNVKVPDLKGSSSTTAKSYDPPPEYYRGVSSTSKEPTTSASDSATASFVSKPVTFPDASGHTKYNSNELTQKLASTYNNWQQLHGGQAAQDRISIKFGGGGGGGVGDPHGLTAGYAHGGGGGSSHIYTDYGAGGHGGGYYGGPNSAEVAGGIPFDVYGGGKGGSGQYAGAGGEYSYTYPAEGGVGGHEPAVHKDYHNLTKKTLLAKSFLIPLASAAVLGIAAALISHPWLLQLGAVSGTPLGATVLGKRRRRRDVRLVTTAAGDQQQQAPLYGSDIAYRAHQPSGGVGV